MPNLLTYFHFGIIGPVSPFLIPPPPLLLPFFDTSSLPSPLSLVAPSDDASGLLDGGFLFEPKVGDLGESGVDLSSFGHGFDRHRQNQMGGPPGYHGARSQLGKVGRRQRPAGAILSFWR